MENNKLSVGGHLYVKLHAKAVLFGQPESGKRILGNLIIMKATVGVFLLFEIGSIPSLAGLDGIQVKAKQ
jgi:hypothetical protein